MQETLNQLGIGSPVLIAIIVAVIALFVIAILIFGWAKTKQTLLFLMLQAKRYAKDKILTTGDEQVVWVVSMAMTKVPRKWLVILQMIATIRGKTLEEQIREIVKYLFDTLRDYADDGKINGSNTKSVV